jgi:hypothetical protein
MILMIFFETSPRHFIPNISKGFEARCLRFDAIIGSFPQKLSDIFMRDLCITNGLPKFAKPLLSTVLTLLLRVESLLSMMGRLTTLGHPTTQIHQTQRTISVKYIPKYSAASTSNSKPV